jgi:hypothetical protein
MPRDFFDLTSDVQNIVLIDASTLNSGTNDPANQVGK